MAYLVAIDGSGDFRSIQEAINAAPCNSRETILINVKAGTYKEVIRIGKNKSFIRLVGQGMDQTIITFDNYAGKLNDQGEKLGTGNSASVFIDGDDFVAEGITFENSYYQPGLDAPGRQAVAVNTSGERSKFIGCAFKGYQDTLYVREGSSYFLDCYVEGDIDFIFGAAQAVFKKCIIHSLFGGSDEDNGYVTAASTKASDTYGLIFDECILTGDDEMPNHTVYLGRPWHPSARTASVCSATLFINCEMGAHIKDEGWSVMGEVSPETERLYEYNNIGEGAFINPSRRQLTEEEIQGIKAIINKQ